VRSPDPQECQYDWARHGASAKLVPSVARDLSRAVHVHLNCVAAYCAAVAERATAVVAPSHHRAGFQRGQVEGTAESGSQELLYLKNISAAATFDADLTRIPRKELRTRRPAA